MIALATEWPPFHGSDTPNRPISCYHANFTLSAHRRRGYIPPTLRTLSVTRSPESLGNSLAPVGAPFPGRARIRAVLEVSAVAAADFAAPFLVLTPAIHA